MNNAFYKTAKELSELGYENLPSELKNAEHLIYSSPSTLSFNSPGAKGFGVKRAGLAVPDSVMLLVSPGCCGRNTSLFRAQPEYRDRFFFQLLDDTDIVTGRHLTKIPQACEEMLEALKKNHETVSEEPYKNPSAIMICITCVDALLGTDMERVCRKVTEKTGIPSVACYMYALTREKRLPPMSAVRTSVYSLLEKCEKRNSADVNILGYFTPLFESSELYPLLKSIGVKNIRELSRCQNFEEYKELSKANFNLVLNLEARAAAQDIQERLGIPFIEMLRLYRPEKIRNQYKLLGQALGVTFDDDKFYQETRKTIDDFKDRYGRLKFAVGEIQKGDALEMALMLAEEGFDVKEVFATVGELNFVFLKRLAQISPDTRVYSNMSPTMLFYDEEDIDIYIGADCQYYHPEKPGIEWCDDNEPFGYDAVKKLFERLDMSLKKGR